jgi:RES domain-containing protein
LIALSELWRISDYFTLSGEGGMHYSARWHTVGHSVVYLASSAAGALLEVLVHLEIDENDLPRPYNLLRVSVAAGIEVERLLVDEGDAWKQNLSVTRAVGDEWLESGRTALAEIPSAIMPATRNYLMNPEHPDATNIEIAETMSASFDLRLLRKFRI